MLVDSLVDPNASAHFQFEVGGISVRLAGAGLESGLDPVLQLFCVTEGIHDIHIQASCVARLSATALPPLFDSGTTWRLYKSAGGFQFDFVAPVFGKQPYKRLTTDRHFLRATVELSEESFADLPSSPSPLEYPLDELLIMHRLTQEKAIELHGCGIVRADGTGNLFVGHSGAGKSTTTRLWTEREDVEVLSDDRIIVRRDNKKQVPHRRCAPVRNDNEKGSSDPGRIRMYGTPWHGEAMYASPNSAPLARIFVLEHGHGNVITRLTPSQAVAELFARAFVPFHRHEYVESALTFLEEVVEEIPVYRYAFEPNEAAVEVVAGFQD